MRRIYSERHQCLVHHIRERLASLLEVSAVQAGLQTIAHVGHGLNAQSVAEAAARRNIDVVPLCRYAHSSARVIEAVQIAFAAVDEHAIRKGVEQLGRAFEDLRVQTAGDSSSADGRVRGRESQRLPDTSEPRKSV